MNKLLKILGIAVLLVVLVIAGGVGFLMLKYPDVPPASAVTIDPTPELLARGEYLAKHVSVCLDCHSTKQFQFYSSPPDSETYGMGGLAFTEEMGFPGKLYVRNITPAALKDWTDGEILRAITAGVDKDGKALFPMMPYDVYKHFTERDAQAVVAYVRTLKPIENEVPERSIDFPLNLIMRTIPSEYVPTPEPDTTNAVAYGEYLTHIAGCRFCHTPVDDMGQPIEGMDFGGGQEFPGLEGTSISMNITPDEDTGIGGWDEQTFIEVFRSYSPEMVRSQPLDPGDPNTEMPWSMYSAMKTSDLSAIYAYLRTVKPIKHSLERYRPNTEPATSTE